MQLNIKEEIEKFAIELFGDAFRFRPGQLEVIQNVVENVNSNIKQTVLEAPTGSGKSIIGILAAYTLYKLYDKTSYILTSDLSLYAQYENDIRRLKSDVFGCIKGKENYICFDNGCPVSQSTCALKGQSMMSISKGYEFLCKDRCQYYHDYIKAVNSPITLMTYQLYFIQRNYVEDSIFGGKNKNFPERDLVIADECHKICDICQTHFAPVISFDRPKWMQTLDKYVHDYPLDAVRMNIVNAILDANTNSQLIEAICRYAGYLSHYCDLNESIRKKLASKKKLSKDDKSALFAGNSARQAHCKIDDLLSFVSENENNEKYLVKTCDENSVTLNFVLDNVMLKKYFHERSKCELLMSATIGDAEKYADIAGLEKDSFKHVSMKSTFDFSKSLIYFSSSNMMSYAEKDNSFRKVAMQAIDICRKNKNYRGIIQTGSYSNSKRLKSLLPFDVLSRCIFYEGSKQKNDVLNEFVSCENPSNDNSILIGPTLIEGINLPNDLCRFQICIKVPFAHLGSEYVRKKKECVDGWYQYDVLNKLCQGIGRGIRHETDWCETYILDGCISSLIGKLSDIKTLRGRFVEFSYWNA